MNSKSHDLNRVENSFFLFLYFSDLGLLILDGGFDGRHFPLKCFDVSTILQQRNRLGLFGAIDVIC